MSSQKLRWLSFISLCSVLLISSTASSQVHHISESETHSGGVYQSPAPAVVVYHEHNNPLLHFTGGSTTQGLEVMVIGGGGGGSGGSGNLLIDSGSQVSLVGTGNQHGHFGSYGLRDGAYIGAGAGQPTDYSGRVTVSGNGSAWTMTNPDEIWGAQLHIGTSGSSGHLEILDGGFVSSKTAFVSNGSATIQGPGSIWRTEKHWQNSGSLSSGDIENFQLSVLDGGQLQVGTDLWLGAIETHRTTEVLISGEGSTIRAGMLYLGTNTTATIEKGGLLRVDRFDSYNQHQGVLVVGEGGQVVITEFVGGANAPAIRVANHAAILLESSSFYWNNLFFNSRPLEQSGNYVNGRITVKDVHGVFHVIGDATRRNYLQGSGEVVGRVSLGSGGWLAAGNSTGTFTATHATFNGGAGFQFEINSAVGIAGTDVGWDLLNLTGVLDIAATGDNPFFLDINSMGLQLADFDSNQNYAWNFVYAAGGINGFSADAFELDFSNFQNDLAGGSFSVVQNGNYLTLNFTAVPEPSAMTLVLLLVSIGMARRRRSARPLTAVNPEGAPSGLLEQRP